MSIPSDPLQSPGPSNQPTNPPSGTPPASGQPPAIAPQGGTPGVDPTGVWTKFLSQSGTPPTPEELKLFIQGLLKWIDVVIQQQKASQERANEVLKKAAEEDQD